MCALRRLILGVVLVVTSGSCLLAESPQAGVSQATGPIETGATDLREVLREAIKADVERYPFGEIECDITSRDLDGPENSLRSVVHSWWDKGKSFTIVKTTTKQDPIFVKSRSPINGILTDVSAYEETICDNRIMTVNHDSKRVRIASLSATRKLPMTSVTPADFWFGKIDGERQNWDWLLGPGPKQPFETFKQCDAQVLPDDRLHIVFTCPDEKGSFRLVASLKDWKVLSFDGKATVNGAPQTMSYDYTWNQSGRLLKRLVHRMKTGKQPESECVYEVKKVELVSRPAASRFEIDERKIPVGYLVDNKIAKRH
jgi:hypothetical protein